MVSPMVTLETMETKATSNGPMVAMVATTMVAMVAAMVVAMVVTTVGGRGNGTGRNYFIQILKTFHLIYTLSQNRISIGLLRRILFFYHFTFLFMLYAFANHIC